jgi:biopolymer transport protein ExbD
MHKTGGLNLVSLMDIFTILVFFLMVNSSEVKVLQQDKKVELPTSTAERIPGDNLVITVSGNVILVQGRPVAELDGLFEGELIPGLKSELEYQAQRKNVPQDGSFTGHQVTLVADKSTPYRLLRSIMATCTAAQFTQVSLAVSKTAKAKEA